MNNSGKSAFFLEIVLFSSEGCFSFMFFFFFEPAMRTDTTSIQFLITTNHLNPFPLLSCLFPFHSFYVSFCSSTFSFISFYLYTPTTHPLPHKIQKSMYHSVPSQANLDYVSYIPYLSTKFPPKWGLMWVTASNTPFSPPSFIILRVRVEVSASIH